MYNKKYGYNPCEDWAEMQVVWVSCPRDAADLEKLLISHYKGTKATGLYNVSPGGESCPRVPPVFTYCVFGLKQ